MRKSSVILSLLSGMIFFACSTKESPTASGQDSPAPDETQDSTPIVADTEIIQEPAPILIVDTFYDNFAGLYAGDTNTIKSVIDTVDWPSWIEYSKKFREGFVRADNALRQGVDLWRDSILNTKIDESLDLVYLFSGPDVLYPRMFFPDADNVYMCALEPVNALPDYTSFSANKVEQYQKDIKAAFENIVGDSYYITSYMSSELRSDVEGVLPMMLVTAKIKGGTIEEVFFFEPDKEGAIDTVENGKANGVSIRVRYPDNEVQQYIYYSGNIGNEEYAGKAGLKANSNLRTYFENFPVHNSFIKAASYIPHNTRGFSIAVDAIYDGEAIFQDPTGIKCSMASRDTSRTMYVMGTMKNGCKPLHHFEWITFDCLISYFRNNKDLILEEPPFKFGYQKRQKECAPCFNYQLIVKK